MFGLAKCLLLRLKREREEKFRNAAAIIIQCAIRQKIARRKSAFWRKLRDEEVKKERVRAAVVIQAAWRAFISNRWVKVLSDINRKRISEEKMLRELQRKTALIIQCVYRQHMARKKLKFLRHKLRMGYCILRIIRGYLIRKNFLRKRHAIIKVQNFIRAVKAKKDFMVRLVQHQRNLAKLDRFVEKAVSISIENIKEELFTVALEEIVRQQETRLKEAYNKHSYYRTLNVRMSLGIPLLRELASVGPAKVVKWGLYSKLLSFDDNRGYRIGSMLKQVLKATDCDSNQTDGTYKENISGDDMNVDGKKIEERVIKIARKEERVNTRKKKKVAKL